MSTNAGKKYYICATAQEADLDQAGFEALTWVRIGNVGAFPEIGRNEPIATYNTHDNGVLKGKGSNDPGSGDLECAYAASDVGQIELRTAGATKKNWAFKVLHDDATDSLTATVDYCRAIVSGPRHPNGSDEDFRREVYSLGINQHLRILPEAVGS
jgi:hypothetical protein